jgi:hypothetical protein
MARFKPVDMSPRFLPIVLEQQIIPGTFDHALQVLSTPNSISRHSLPSSTTTTPAHPHTAPPCYSRLGSWPAREASSAAVPLNAPAARTSCSWGRNRKSCERARYFMLPNTLPIILLPVPIGSRRIAFSSSPIM